MSLHGAALAERPSVRTPRGLPHRSLAFLAAAIAVLALEWVWQGETYWLYSEGVYLATARSVADGADLYRQVAAAQPPPIFYIGAGLLEVSDSLLWARAALSTVTLVTGGLVALCVWRLTGRSFAATLAGLASLVMPWTLREHATLTPEPLAAPLLLGAALLAARTRLAAAAGAVATLAVTLKLAFVLPAAAVGLAAVRRTRFFLTAGAVGLLLAASFLLIWGGPLIDNLVVAQRQTGFQPEILPGLYAQAIWNLAPLLALAALALAARKRARDPALMQTLLALLAGSLALIVTFVKDGSYLNLLAVIEPAAVPLAAAGLVWLIEDRSWLGRGRRPVAVAAVAASVFIAAQSLGVLLAPGNPVIFGNPFLSRPPGYELSDEGVRQAAESARACPPGVPYSGSPFVAFVAGRPLPAGQPDRFIVAKAATHADLQAQIIRSQPRCPSPPGS